MNPPSDTPGRPPTPQPGTLRLGSVNGVGVYVRTSWLLVAVLIAVLLGPRIDVIAPGLGALVYVAGLAFAVLLYLSVLLHEISHALMAQRFGMPVRSVTLHFLGGVTEIEGEAETPSREFWIAVVGPITSLAVSAVAFGAVVVTPDGLVRFAFEALAGANLVVGLINLVPGLPLDGGRVLRALVWKVTGRPLTATVVAAWAGRGVAVLVLGYPFLLQEAFDVRPSLVDFLLSGVIAIFLWTSASQSLAGVRLRQKLPALRARELGRRALGVPSDVPLGEAVRRAREAGAGSLVVIDEVGDPSGLVSEHAVLATPEDRRPWLAVGALARTLQPGMTLSADLAGEPLIRAMQTVPSTEYLLVETDGSVFGVLVTADVDAAFGPA